MTLKVVFFGLIACVSFRTLPAYAASPADLIEEAAKIIYRKLAVRDKPALSPKELHTLKWNRSVKIAHFLLKKIKMDAFAPDAEGFRLSVLSWFESGLFGLDFDARRMSRHVEMSIKCEIRLRKSLFPQGITSESAQKMLSPKNLSLEPKCHKQPDIPVSTRRIGAEVLKAGVNCLIDTARDRTKGTPKAKNKKDFCELLEDVVTHTGRVLSDKPAWTSLREWLSSSGIILPYAVMKATPQSVAHAEAAEIIRVMNTRSPITAPVEAKLEKALVRDPILRAAYAKRFGVSICSHSASGPCEKYDTSGNLIRSVDSNGNKFEYEYDDQGNLTKVTFSDSK